MTANYPNAGRAVSDCFAARRLRNISLAIFTVQFPKLIRRKIFLSLLPVLALAGVSSARAVELPFNDGWRFTKDDDPAMGTNLTLSAISQWSLPTANPFTTNAPLARNP